MKRQKEKKSNNKTMIESALKSIIYIACKPIFTEMDAKIML